MSKLFSYVIPYDDGAAPNPFWGTCTLTICKPAIRRVAKTGDWVVGTGSKNVKLKDGNIYDFSNAIVYAMKVTQKMSLERYDEYCKRYLVNKIPKSYTRNFRQRIGDCIYDYKDGFTIPKLRKSVHTEENRDRDMRGKNSLLSKHFYYFGEEPKIIPNKLKYIIKRGQNHYKFEDVETIKKFENWISNFKRNKIYAEPQLKYEFEIIFRLLNKYQNVQQDILLVNH